MFSNNKYLIISQRFVICLALATSNKNTKKNVKANARQEKLTKKFQNLNKYIKEKKLKTSKKN